MGGALGTLRTALCGYMHRTADMYPPPLHAHLHSWTVMAGAALLRELLPPPLPLPYDGARELAEVSFEMYTNTQQGTRTHALR